MFSRKLSVFHRTCFCTKSCKNTQYTRTLSIQNHCYPQRPFSRYQIASSSPKVVSSPLNVVSSPPNARTHTIADHGPPMSLSKKLKRYGISFVLVDFCTWSLSVSTFFCLYSVGVEMVSILDFAQQLIDVAYWADTLGVSYKSLTSDTAALSLALVSATITFPIRLCCDMLILVFLNRLGIICGPKQTM